MRAPFSAFCCRARALPPALAARLRAALLRVEPPERALDDLLLDDLLPDDLLPDDLLLEERPPEDDELVDRREPVEDEERRLLDELLLRLRVPEPELELLRALEAFLRGDEPPPLPLFDSAISILLKGVSAPRGGRRTISCPPMQ